MARGVVESRYDSRPRRRGAPPEHPRHGSGRSYVRALEARLPEYDVAYAAAPAAERDLFPSATVVAGLDAGEELLDRADSLKPFACSYAGVDHAAEESGEWADLPNQVV